MFKQIPKTNLQNRQKKVHIYIPQVVISVCNIYAQMCTARYNLISLSCQIYRSLLLLLPKGILNKNLIILDRPKRMSAKKGGSFVYELLSQVGRAPRKSFVCSISTPLLTLHPPAEPGCAQGGMCHQGKVGHRQGGRHVPSFQSPKLEPRRCLHIQETFFSYESFGKDDNKERLREMFSWKQRQV